MGRWGDISIAECGFRNEKHPLKASPPFRVRLVTPSPPPSRGRLGRGQTWQSSILQRYLSEVLAGRLMAKRGRDLRQVLSQEGLSAREIYMV